METTRPTDRYEIRHTLTWVISPEEETSVSYPLDTPEEEIMSGWNWPVPTEPDFRAFGIYEWEPQPEGHCLQMFVEEFDTLAGAQAHLRKLTANQQGGTQ